MNSRNEDKLSMYEKVKLFLKDHIAQIEALIPNTATVKTELDQKIDELMVIISNAGEQTTGYTLIKENARIELENAMVRIIRGLKAVAVDNNLLALKNKVDYSRSSIERLRDSEIYTTGLRIAHLAEENKDALANYATPFAHITHLKSLNAAFFEVIQLPKDKIGERASYNSLIDVKLNEIDKLLRDKLDTYMSIIELDEATLYTQYRSARSIDDSRGKGSTKQYKGEVAEGLTAVVVQQDYEADRSYTFYNNSEAELSFGLSADGTTISGVTLTLQQGDEASRDASDLNDSGNFLIVINKGKGQGVYEVTVDK